MIRRGISKLLNEALQDRPVILLQGARQTGKTTLARAIAEDRNGTYLTLDDASTVSAVRADAQGTLEGLLRSRPRGDGNTPATIVIDEVQKGPDLFSAIKLAVDRERRAGQFLLTGSANPMMVPNAAESLAGRMELLTLWPLSQDEVEGTIDIWVDAAFSEDTFRHSRHPDCSIHEVLRRALAGGFPEVFPMAEHRRRAWFDSYLTSVLQRDIRDLADIDGLSVLPRMMTLLASRVGSLVNHADMSRSLSIPVTTLRRYFSLLEATFLLRTVPPWFSNTNSRVVKSPKLYLCDTGLLGACLSWTLESVNLNPVQCGPLIENFVIMEVLKQCSWSVARPKLYHFRTVAGREVDLVLEGPGGRIVGIEVKAAGQVASADFNGLRTLAELVGPRFVRGVVLYAGTTCVPFGERLVALPITALWTPLGPT